MRILGAFPIAAVLWAAVLLYAFVTESPWAWYALVGSQFGVSACFVLVLALSCLSRNSSQG
jgi:hypothetical protein